MVIKIGKQEITNEGINHTREEIFPMRIFLKNKRVYHKIAIMVINGEINGRIKKIKVRRAFVP